MKQEAKEYVINTLKDKLSTWIDRIREKSANWTKPVTGEQPYTFAVPLYDKYRLEEGKEGEKKKKVFSTKEKKPDGIEILNIENNFYILVRKKERLLTAVLAWNQKTEKYNLFLSMGIIDADKNKGPNNKTHWLHLIIRRCIIVSLREKCSKEGGYKKNKEKTGVVMEYLGLPTIFALIAKSVETDSQLPKWITKNQLALHKYQLAFSRFSTPWNSRITIAYTRANNAIKELRNYFTGNRK